MEISSLDFKNSTKTILEALKHVDHASIKLPSYTYGDTLKALLSICGLRFRNVAKMYQYIQHMPIPTREATLANVNQRRAFWDALQAIVTSIGSETTPETKRTSVAIDDSHRSVSSVRLLPEAIPEQYRPKLLQVPPLETTEGDRTYRFVVSVSRDNAWHNEISLISRDTDPLYDYLDQGHFLMIAEQTNIKGKLEKCVVVSDRYDVNTAHIFMLCRIQPSLADLLKNKCFASHNDAELVKLRMLKKLSAANKAAYDKVSHTIEEDYKKNSTLVLLNKLIDGSVSKTTLNNVELSKNKAVYENISVELEDLLGLLQTSLNFNSEYDIYSIVGVVGNHLQGKSDRTILPSDATSKHLLATLSINDIPISLEMASTGQRYINDIRINKDEVGAAIVRASCHNSLDNYKLFLKSISRLSIKHHDILANGLAVKIHSNMTDDEYRLAIPTSDAPVLKFKLDKATKRVHLEVSATKSVPVHFNKLIGRVETMNSRTDNKYTRSYAGGYYSNRARNYRWAAEQLVDILISASTFAEETVIEGTKSTQRKIYITKGDVELVLEAANDGKRAAIARSKEFMDMAVKSTSAEKIDFMGKPAYKVTGKLRTYAVIIQSAKVYDFDSKQYRCIVNSSHYQGAGYDDIATRLLALKNDSMTQDSIGTLKGAAQPQYDRLGDNVNDAERDGLADTIESAISKAFSNLQPA